MIHLSHRRQLTILSLFSRYFHGISFNELHTLIPQQLAFTTGTRHAMYTRVNHPCYHCILVVKNKFHSETLFISCFVEQASVRWFFLIVTIFPYLILGLTVMFSRIGNMKMFFFRMLIQHKKVTIFTDCLYGHVRGESYIKNI